MNRLSVPFPEDDYLLALGRISYSVGYLEWAVLGHLPQIPDLPSELDLRALVGRTTGGIGRQLQNPTVVAKVVNPALRAWLQEAGQRLIRVAELRNSVLHARPATVKGQQRLHRWDPERGEIFTLTQRRLDAIIADINDSVRGLGPPPV